MSNSTPTLGPLVDRLWQAASLEDAAALFAAEAAVVVGCGRVSVVGRQQDRLSLLACGIETPDSRSPHGQQLTGLAVAAVTSRGPVWSSHENDASMQTLLGRCRAESGAELIAVIPSRVRTIPADSPVPPAEIVTVWEWFAGSTSGTQLVEPIVAATAAPLEAARLKSLLPWWRGGGEFSKRGGGRWLIAGVLVCVCGLALAMIPAELTFRAEGELWPAQRRHVFAAASGTVDRLQVVHGQQVRAGEPLLHIRDRDLELDLRRLEGELATAKEKLRVLQATRLVGPDSDSRLSGDEEEIKELIAGVEGQLAISRARAEELTQLALAAGTVLTWDVHGRLADRPVERGQLLLTLGETDGAWVLELQVDDADAGRLLSAAHGGIGARIDFVLPSAPERHWTARVAKISQAVETDSFGRGFVRVTARVEPDLPADPRPGAAAVGKAYCGQAALGYVWFRDLIDAARTWW